VGRRTHHPQVAKRKSRKHDNKRGPTPRRRGVIEWVGSIVRTPDESLSCAAWVEHPRGVVQALEALGDDELDGALGRTLVRALGSTTRKPNRVVVKTNADVAAMTAVVPRGIKVVVGDTAALSDLVAEIEETLRIPKSHLAGEDVTPELVGALFEAAATLHRAAPWRVVDEETAIQLDVPALGIEAACVALTGKTGPDKGLLLFPSIDAYDLFLAADEAAMNEEELELKEDAEEELAWHCELSFGSPDALHPAMQMETKTHGWPVADSDAHPALYNLHALNGDTEACWADEVRLMTALANAVAKFVPSHREAFTRQQTEAREAYPLDGEDELLLSAPFRELPQSVLSPMARIDLNLAATIAGHAPSVGPASMLKALDRLVEAGGPEIAMAWAAYGAKLDDGHTVADRFVAESDQVLTPEQRSCLDARAESWLSIFTIQEVDAGQTLVLKDRLTERELVVHRPALADPELIGACLLGLAAEVDDEGLVAAHERVLNGEPLSLVLEAFATATGSSGALTCEQLRGETALELLRCWNTQGQPPSR
jgi:hypothetical protein